MQLLLFWNKNIFSWLNMHFYSSNIFKMILSVWPLVLSSVS